MPAVVSGRLDHQLEWHPPMPQDEVPKLELRREPADVPVASIRLRTPGTEGRSRSPPLAVVPQAAERHFLLPTFELRRRHDTGVDNLLPLRVECLHL
jgi:hypothetical protein